MRVGITYDLRSEYIAEGYGEEETAEFDRPETIEAIAQALRQLGHEVDRIGRARALIGRLAQGDRWDLVFNICEGLRGLAREAQVPAILEVYDIPYTFADPVAMGVCLHKELAKTVVRAADLPTARSALVAAPEDISSIGLPFPLFAKPVAEGTGKGVTPQSHIANTKQLNDTCMSLLHQFRQPVLVEEYLAGREFTVGILGTDSNAEVLGTLEIVLKQGAEPGVYSYTNKEHCETLVEYRPIPAHLDAEVAAAERVALAAWRTLGCRDGGRIDLRSNQQQEPQFMEANPLAGMHPSHSDLPMLATAVGMEYQELIRRIVESASRRAGRP